MKYSTASAPMLSAIMAMFLVLQFAMSSLASNSQAGQTKTMQLPKLELFYDAETSKSMIESVDQIAAESAGKVEVQKHDIGNALVRLAYRRKLQGYTKGPILSIEPRDGKFKNGKFKNILFVGQVSDKQTIRAFMSAFIKTNSDGTSTTVK